MWNSKDRPQEARLAPGSERWLGLLVWVSGASSIAVSGPTAGLGSMATAVDREERCAAA